MEIIGYKCFDEGLINRYGKKFSVGQIYIAPGSIKFGTFGNGFHMCKNIEDTFRYFDCLKNKVDVCLVKGSGDLVEYSDDYYGYYDMYSVKNLEILKQLTRGEIINQGLNLYEKRAERFVSLFKLTKEEIALFKENYKNNNIVLDAIAYYQEKDIEVYNRKCKTK